METLRLSLRAITRKSSALHSLASASVVLGLFALWASLPGCGNAMQTFVCDPACPAGYQCTQGGCTAITTTDMQSSPDLAIACSPGCSGATPVCSAGQCVACLIDTDCPYGEVCKTVGQVTLCSPGCASDNRCAAGAGDGGTSTMKCCGGQCLDTASDPANCGACGTACTGNHANGTCMASACTGESCDPGWADCNMNPKDGCETNLHIDTANCTACGMACVIPNAIVGCSDNCYIAACQFGWDDCNGNLADGCETNVLSDAQNCGACGTVCQGVPHAEGVCENAACSLTKCDVGYFDCNGLAGDGCEVAIATDPKNCGQCGNACAQGLICVNGGCTCQQCNIPNAKTACVNNVCTLAACLPGYSDCNNNAADGCEVNTGFDSKNCGGCGMACPVNTPYCTNSTCTLINNSVLIVYASSYEADVKSNLTGTGAFSKVDDFNGGAGTPTLQQLQGYGAVLAYSDSGFSDPATLGNNLADYQDGGGSVVVATFANAAVPVTGRFGTPANGYMLVQPGQQEEPNDSLGVINEPQSPLMVGVTKITATAAYRSTGLAINGGIVVAAWTSGKPMVVRGVVKGRNMVGLNFYPPSNGARVDFVTGDVAPLLRNAMLYR